MHAVTSLDSSQSSTQRSPTMLAINNYYYRRGGAEAVFFEQNRLFEELGWQVVPFAMRHEENLPSDWDRFFVDEIEFGKNYSFFQQARLAQKVIYSFEARRQVNRLIENARPELAHAHNVYHHLSPSIFGALAANEIPTFLTLHDLKIACPAYKMLAHDGLCERCKGGAIWNVVQNRCVKNSLPLSAVVMLEAAAHRVLGSYSKGVTRFIVPSRFYLEKFVEWGWPRERFVHIPNSVDVQALLPSGAPGKAFVFFGRLAPEKGLLTLVRAAALARVKVLIVGSGPEEEKLRNLVHEIGADVEFLGHRTGERLFGLIRSARAVVLPSEWYENAPVSVMEAYALQRPVIGANIGGIPELIRHGETGWIFQSGDIEGLAKAMSHVAGLSDSAVLKMGASGRAWMESEFSPALYREKLLNLYRISGVRC